jgi:peptidoglycan hydrolase-like protein with peptidoglycan-binding domain
MYFKIKNNLKNNYYYNIKNTGVSGWKSQSKVFPKFWGKSMQMKGIL